MIYQLNLRQPEGEWITITGNLPARGSMGLVTYKMSEPKASSNGDEQLIVFGGCDHTNVLSDQVFRIHLDLDAKTYDF